MTEIREEATFEYFFDRLGIFDDFFDGLFGDATDDAVGLSAGIECAFLTGEYAYLAKKTAFA